jgi:CheY-like chemotaxis protein
MKNQKCSHTILIAEDDPDDQELITFAFSKVDPSLKLSIVNNGKEVLDYLFRVPVNHLPCMILLDYNMPELNAAQVTKLLNPDERFNFIPIVILSTSDNPIYIHDCLENGAIDYIKKPDDFKILIKIAKEMADICRRNN